jgi:DNA-binding response OmpR family regulator
MPEKNKIKVLIAEDEKPMNKAMKTKLEASGFDVFQAFDGEEAVVILEKEKPDIMLLDLIMPNLDGFGVLEKTDNEKCLTAILSNLIDEGVLN